MTDVQSLSALLARLEDVRGYFDAIEMTTDSESIDKENQIIELDDVMTGLQLFIDRWAAQQLELKDCEKRQSADRQSALANYEKYQGAIRQVESLNAESEKVRSEHAEMQWALENVHIIARRAMNAPSEDKCREKLPHILRICEQQSPKPLGGSVLREVAEARPAGQFTPAERAKALNYALGLMRDRVTVEAPTNAAAIQRHIYALIELVAGAPEARLVEQMSQSLPPEAQRLLNEHAFELYGDGAEARQETEKSATHMDNLNDSTVRATGGKNEAIQTTCAEFNGPSDRVLLPADSIVHQGGIPVLLITGALVRVARGNVPMLVGHHMGAAYDPPAT